ncbi:pullulanase-associated domain-containing protein [Niveibacterium umoris]|uniref:Pullulanase carbohydrate-binding module 41 domain-containing protein n=1 Tax=Niveibacterium umoris TaxID=1193620 RepID=A0A840BRR5_9RHOO|nr:pullulanase-associated domain-containing protein [Niveibacterium umoris]MBB4013506.1 hypothetical protein [Niveibacterium umoris]
MKKTMISLLAVALLGTSVAYAEEQDTSDLPEKPTGLQPWTLRVHYQRDNKDYEGWGVYAWKGPRTGAPKWPGNWRFNRKDAFGVFYDVPLGEGATMMEFLITDGKGNKNCPNDQKLELASSLAQKGQEVWLRQGECKIHATKPKN